MAVRDALTFRLGRVRCCAAAPRSAAHELPTMTHDDGTLTSRLPLGEIKETGEQVLGHIAGALRFEQEVDRIARGIVDAGLCGSYLCGYSLGARVALGLLARHAHRFAGATLIGVHPGLSSPDERAAERERGIASVRRG